MKLEVHRPPETTHRIEVTEFPADIGRDRECPIFINHSRVSRRHATVIERDGEIFITDLGSTNGVRVNGEQIEEKILQEGDVVSLGDVRIHVLELPQSALRATTTAACRRLPTFRRRQALAIAGPVVVALVVLGLIGRWVLQEQRSSARSGGPRGVATVERELGELKGVIAAAARVTPAIISRVVAFGDQHGDVSFEGGVHPVDEFLVELRSRRDLEVHNRLFEFSSKRQQLVETKRYGELSRLLEEMQMESTVYPLVARRHVEDFAEQTRGVVAAAFEDFQQQLSYLEAATLGDDCVALCERARRSFAGSKYVTRIEARLATYVAELEKIRDEKQRQVQELSGRLEAFRRKESAPAGDDTPRQVDLSALLEAPIRGGKLESRKYDFGAFRGRPTSLREDGVLIVATTGGEKTISLADVPHQVQLRMARSCLSGEALVEAATFGYEWELPRNADELLHQYLREKGASPEARQRRIELVLATARGLGDVPDGGFTYHPTHGWEDAEQQATRMAVAEAARLTRKLTATASVRTLEADFEKIAAAIEKQGVSTSAGHEIRRRVIATLREVKNKLVQQVERTLKRSGFDHIRAAKQELNRRRAAALRFIFDTATYLPEDHADYPRGDAINGQAEVDRLLGAVRELWKSAARFAVRLDASTSKRIDRLRVVRETFFPRLRHTATDDQKDPLENIWDNLDRSVDLRSFALDRTENRLYRHNRQVEQYNRELDAEDVTDTDRAHVAVVNDYREMLGLRRLFIDPRLCRATRKHSVACDRAGRIWHNGPDGSPSSRARAEGFGASVGENVAIGYSSPADIWTRGWYRASDHHRNAVGVGWTCIGYGYSGQVGTQNFAAIGAPF